MAAGGMRLDDDSARGAPATVFVSDPSAEADGIAQTLRGAGYVVVDVPLSMLVARVAVQRPRVILVDADADGALDAVSRVRELPDAEGIDVLFLGRLGGVFSRAEDALAHEGSGFFPRPVDVETLVKKIASLAGAGNAELQRSRNSTPPPSIPSSASPSRPPASLPPASMRATPPSSSHPPAPRAAPSAAPRLSQRPLGLEAQGALSSDPSRRAVATPLSSELEQLLAEAEQRVPVQVSPESVPPTPEEEIEAVLPAELLEALDEPLAEEDDDDASHEAPASRGLPAVKSTTTGVVGTGSGTGAGGTGAGTTGSRRVSGAPKPLTGESALTPLPPKTHGGGTHGGGTHTANTSSSGVTGAGSDAGRAHVTPQQSPPAPVVPPQSLRGGSQPPPTAYSPPQDMSPVSSAALPARVEVSAPMIPPTVVGVGDAAKLAARAIATRVTGSVAFDADGASRRLVLREGDAVTVASTSEEESLLAFLGVRGELPRETVRRLAGKFPGFGRHAGAALVAHGYLRQDQLWPTLRAHAEWILGRVLQSTGGTCVHEPEAPGRLRTEPGVFGGSTGAEVFVEVLRRVVPAVEAIERMGGPASRIADGPSGSLLSECALTPAEVELVTQSHGGTVQQALDASPETDIAAVLYAMSLLGVVETLRAVGHGAQALDGDGEASRADVDALDEDAIRARVKARVQLVDEGDYFAVLGVPRNATSYEVRRAFVELRRAFEPSRLLTPAVADLADEVRKIVVVLEEAYEILRDAARRERYRRAIDATPA
jgi:hypothetical protein